MRALDGVKLIAKDGAVRLEVRARPRAHKSRLVGERDGALEVQLAAPPVDGAANAELVETLARVVGVAKSAVRVIRGETGRNKLVEIAGVDMEGVREALRQSRGAGREQG